MPWTKKYKLVTVTGEYTSKTTGEVKKNYFTMGFEWENERGQRYLKIEAIPIGFTGFIQKFNVDDQAQAPAPQQNYQTHQTPQHRTPLFTAGANYADDDLPF